MKIERVQGNQTMKAYVILCDCGERPQVPVFWEAVDGRNVVALIDDERPRHSLRVESNPMADRSEAVEPLNKRGDRESVPRLRCPGCLKGAPKLIRLSTYAAILDRIAPEASSLGFDRIDFYEEDVPATVEDEDLMRERFNAEIDSGEYTGPEPKFVPRYVQRVAIPFAGTVSFLAMVSQVQKVGRR